MEENSDISEDELISSYFFQGYTNAEIVEFLKLHGISMSLSTVKRRLRTVGLGNVSQHPLNYINNPVIDMKSLGP